MWGNCMGTVKDDAEPKHNLIQKKAGVYTSAYIIIVAGNG